MSLAENSFQDQAESPSKLPSHSLCSELANEQFKWSNSLRGSERSIGDSEGDSDYMQPNSKNSIQLEPDINISNNNNSVEVQPFQQGEEEESGPKTITLIGDSILSKDSMNVSSRISQYSSQVDNEFYASFLSMRQTSYAPLVKGFSVLFQNVCNLFCERSKDVQATYLEFLRIKYFQQKSYSKLGLGKTANNKNHMIYIDCKGLADQIRNKIEKQRIQEKQYADNLGYIYTKAKKQFDSVRSVLKHKETKIRDIVKKLTEISQQMTDIMIPKNRKMKKSSIKEELLSTNYVRTKFLIGKQKEYLLLMKQLLEQVTSYVNHTCCEVEPKYCLIVKEALTTFIEAAAGKGMQVKQLLESKIQVLQKANCYDMIFREVGKLLQICIPGSLDIHLYGKVDEKDKMHQIIEALIRQSQSVVFLPVIEVQGKDYAYHSKNKARVYWRRVDYTQKLKQNQIQEFQAQVIIAHEGYLILELLSDEADADEKMAILKLTNIKLGKKNNHVIITDKGTGVLGYLLSSNSVLGSLIFEGLQSQNKNPNQSFKDALVQQFVDRIKEVMEVRREKLKK